MGSIYGMVSIIMALLVLGIDNSLQQQQTKPLPGLNFFSAPVTYSIDPYNLPAPYATNSSIGQSRIIPQPTSATLTVPQGFKVNVFAENGTSGVAFREPRVSQNTQADPVN